MKRTKWSGTGLDGGNGSGNGGRKDPQDLKATPNPEKTGGSKPDIIELGKPYRFKKGNPGGPGRPKMSLTYELIKQLEELDPDTGRPKFVKFIERQIERAMSRRQAGASAAAQMIFDRIEGLLKQNVQITGLVGVVPIPLGDLTADLQKLTDDQLLLAERIGLMSLQRARAEAKERDGLQS